MMEEKEEEYMNERQGERVKIRCDGGVQNGRVQNARAKTNKIKVLNFCKEVK